MEPSITEKQALAALIQRSYRTEQLIMETNLLLRLLLVNEPIENKIPKKVLETHQESLQRLKSAEKALFLQFGINLEKVG